MASLEELFRKDITLKYEGMDRILLNGYLPLLGLPNADCTTPVQRKPGDLAKLLERPR